jgi:hypothetical protein
VLVKNYTSTTISWWFIFFSLRLFFLKYNNNYLSGNPWTKITDYELKSELTEKYKYN